MIHLVERRILIDQSHLGSAMISCKLHSGDYKRQLSANPPRRHWAPACQCNISARICTWGRHDYGTPRFAIGSARLCVVVSLTSGSDSVPISRDGWILESVYRNYREQRLHFVMKQRLSLRQNCRVLRGLAAQLLRTLINFRLIIFRRTGRDHSKQKERACHQCAYTRDS